MPTLGLLMLQTRFPRPPGDIGHPRTFGFAVRQRAVHGATPEYVVRGSDPALLQPFVDAAQALVAEGCQAIATSCGFLARWRELQAALPVPVWSSALLQLAEQQALGRRCGVITIEAASLGAAHFKGVGADPATPVEGITQGSPLHRTRCCRTCRTWTRPMRRRRCWLLPNGCWHMHRGWTRWCWNAPTCLPLRRRFVPPRGCRC